MQGYSGDIVDGISAIATQAQNTISPILFYVLVIIGIIIVIIFGVLLIFAIFGIITSHLYSKYLVNKYGNWNSRYIVEHGVTPFGMTPFEENEYLLFNKDVGERDDKRT